MILIILFLLALAPLLGIAWVFHNGLVLTVDNLFMSLILLTISGICGTLGLFELRKRKTLVAKGANAMAQGVAAATGGTVRGKVQSVEFFESSVGQTNKSIVTLDGGSTAPVMMVFEGDLRNALPVGQTVEVLVRKESGHNVLLNVSYA
jgi:hypothetical protein